MFIRIKKAVILALNLFLPYFAYLFLVENYFILLKKYNNSSFVHYHLYSSSNQNKKKNFSSLWSITLLLLSSSSFFCFFLNIRLHLARKVLLFSDSFSFSSVFRHLSVSLQIKDASKYVFLLCF